MQSLGLKPQKLFCCKKGTLIDQRLRAVAFDITIANQKFTLCLSPESLAKLSSTYNFFICKKLYHSV